MIEPEYAKNLQLERIPLSGRVLVFGSGQLIHERLFFDFSSVGEVVTYDPYVAPAESLGVPKSTHATDFSELTTATAPFDTILCLFSLHFEPRWLFTLADLFQKLAVGGRFVLAEDRGVRAIFDNASVDAGTVEADVHTENRELYAFVKSIYAERESRDWAAPWFSDISASDYSLMMQVSSVVSAKAGEQVYRLQRTLNRDEPFCYLPWKSCFTSNGAFRTRFDNMPRPEKVTEVVRLTFFKKLRDFPDLCDLDDYLSRAIWNLVSLRAERNVSRILVSLSSSASGDVETTTQHFSRSFLQTAYLNIFRHFQTVKSCEVALGLLSRDPFASPNQASGRMVTELLPANFAPTRELNLTFEKPDWYSDYIERASKIGFLGEFLYERGQPGLYFWHKRHPDIPNKSILRARIPGLHFVEEEEDLRTEYEKAERDPPSCVYLLEPLGRFDDSAAVSRKHALLGAGIAYFSEDYAPEIACLLYVLRSVMPAVVGRSAFIEMLLHQRSASTFQKIRGKLDRIQGKLSDLKQVTEDVESLKVLLDPDYWTPGQERLNALGAEVEVSVLSTQHEINKIPKATLLTALAGSTIKALQESLVSDLRNAGLSTEMTDGLFSLWSPCVVETSLSDSLCFSRAIGKRLFPANWLTVMPNFSGNIGAEYFIETPAVPQMRLLYALWKLGQKLQMRAELTAEFPIVKFDAKLAKEVGRDANKLVENLAQIQEGKTALEIGGGETTKILEVLWNARGTKGAVTLALADSIEMSVCFEIKSHPTAAKEF